MELISINIKNYRIHKDQSVNFSDKLNLIGGANETGKSTIAEAIHRALFFKAKGDSKEHKEMKSLIHSGDPEVELVFKAKGNTCTLYKKFGKGDVRLSIVGQVALIGDAAETKLKELLQTETALGGSSLRNKWALLWVWQGFSNNNPISYITESRDQLKHKLQTIVTTKLLSSTLDTKVAQDFASRKAAIFNNNGTSRAGSDLKKAEDNLLACNAILSGAQTKINHLQKAADNYKTVKESLDQLEKSSIALINDIEKTENRKSKIDELKNNINESIREHGSTKNELDSLKKIKNEIETLEYKIDSLTNQLTPTKNQLAAYKLKLKEDEVELKKKLTLLSEIRCKQKLLINTKDLCQLHIDILKLNKELTKLTCTQIEAEKYKSEIKSEETNLALLLVVNENQTYALRDLYNKLNIAKSALDAISTSFEVIKSQEDVIINHNRVVQGSMVNFTDAFEVTIGENTKFKVTPGGGTSLENAKAKYESLQIKLNKELHGLGFKTVEDADKCCRDREVINRNIELLKISLNGLNAVDIDIKINEIENEISGKQILVQQKSELFGISIDEQSDISKTLSENEKTLVFVNLDISKNEASNKEFENQIEKLQKSISDTTAVIQNDDDRLKEYKNTLSFLIREVSKEQLIENINIKSKEEQSKKAKVLQIEKQLEELNPDDIENDIKRVKRALSSHEIEVNETNKNLMGLELVLTNNGTENPNELLNKAEENHKLASDLEIAERRKANAYELLDKLFTEEQKELTNKLSLPLANKIGYYLEPIFGRDVTVTINQDKVDFNEFIISRKDNGSFSYDTLSGGTKEQFSSAIRLAMAEVLSADYENKLPIVFDDAFTNSDPVRLRNLQSMLDRASNKGLQIIVLSCNPNDYVALGANKTILEK